MSLAPAAGGLAPLAHVDVQPLVAAPWLVLVGGAAVLVPPRVLQLRRSGAAPRPAAAVIAAHPVIAGLVLTALAVVAAALLTASERPAGTLAGIWVVLTLAAAALGPLWAVAGPPRLGATGLLRLIDPEALATSPVPGRLSAALAAGGLAALGWAEHAGVHGVIAATVLVLVLLLALGLGVAFEPRAAERADPLAAYTTVVAETARAGGGAGASTGICAVLVAVPLAARVSHTLLWSRWVAGLDRLATPAAEAGLLVVLVGVALLLLRALAGGAGRPALTTAALAVFASHQLAVLLSPGFGVTADLPPGATIVDDPRLLAASLVPVLALLAGLAAATLRLRRDVGAGRTGRHAAAPAEALLLALAVVTAVLWIRPL